MSEIGRDARALLAAARRAGQGPAAVRRRIRERLLVSVAAGTVTSTALLAEAAMLPVATAAPAGSVMAVAIKAFVVGTAAGAVVTTAASTLSVRGTDPGPAPVALPSERRETIEHRPAPASAPVAAPVASTPAVGTAPISAGSGRVPAKSSIAEETLLLGRVQVALRQGQPGRALELLDQYRETYPRGVLDEEALASRVVALCSSGRSADGRRWAEDFVRRYPRSLHLGRVRAACGEDR
jgi:hypothetical protein